MDKDLKQGVKKKSRAAQIITEKTGLPIGMVVTLLVSVAGAASWVAKVDFHTSQNAEKLKVISVIKADISEIKSGISFIRGRLSSGVVFNRSQSDRGTSVKRTTDPKDGR